MKMNILNELKTKWAGQKCLYFDTLESTNDYAKELAKQNSVHGTVVVADTQTGGKGRRGRVWESEKGKTIAMSICLEPELPGEKISGLTLAAALAVAEAVQEVAELQTQIKWPNDIVCNGKKLCGILTEMIIRENQCRVIVGIGINVNNRHFPKELEGIAGSLKMEIGRELERARLIAAILNHFEKIYEKYVQTGDLSSVKEEYEARLVNKGQVVRVLDPTKPFTGVARGIASDGSLLVLCEDGSMETVSSGEVSVRGLFGYV